MKALISYLILVLIFYASSVKMEEGDDNTPAPVIDQEEFKIADDEVFHETTITWINSTHLIELVSYLINQKRTSQNDVIVIDTRNSDEYNGWHALGNEISLDAKIGLKDLYASKNGHISFAHNLDSDWLDLFNKSALIDFIEYRYGFKARTNNSVDERKLKERTVPIILYDVNKERLGRVKYFLNENFLLKRIYLCQINEQEIAKFVKKINDTSLFFREPFYDMLISPDALNAIIRPVREEGGVKTAPIIDYKLFDVSNDELKYHYGLAHIPTSVHLNTKDLESAPLWNRKNSTELARVFLSHGIEPNNTEMIILYGNPDPMASFRAAIIMKSMGIKNIKILNGGYQSWFDRFLILDANKSVRRSIIENLDENIALFEEQAAEAAKSSINYIVDANYVEDLVKNLELFQDQYALVDIRTYEEYIGDKSGYPDLEIKGRIPGSYWGRAGTNPKRLEDYRNPDLTMRSGLEILRMWDDLDIDYKNKHLIFYSGNGWRSSEVMYYAELMGLYKISMYDGGWYDWSTKFGKLAQNLDEISKEPKEETTEELTIENLEPKNITSETSTTFHIITTTKSSSDTFNSALGINQINIVVIIQFCIISLLSITVWN